MESLLVAVNFEGAFEAFIATTGVEKVELEALFLFVGPRIFSEGNKSKSDVNRSFLLISFFFLFPKSFDLHPDDFASFSLASLSPPVSQASSCSFT